MTAALVLTIMANMGALSDEAHGLVAAWLAKPVLSPVTTKNETRAFILKRVPALKVPQTAAEWDGKRDALRQELLHDLVYRGVPEDWYSGPVHVEWTDTIETGGGYRIRKLRYEAVPGLWIPALFYEPDPAPAKMPAVLNVNGHVGPPGKQIEYEQIRCINLAKRGVLALHPEWLSFGELANPQYRHNDSAYLDLCGVSGLSIFYQAMKRGLDVLADHPATDPKRLGMTGLSGGGWQTIVLSALDPRITLCVPNAGYCGLDIRADYPQDIGDLEQNPVDLLTIADYPHLTAMLAPRPALLIYNAKDDCCFEAARVWPNIYEPIIPFYNVFDATPKFQRHENVDPGTHNYDLDNRLAFYRFVSEQWDLGWADEELPCDGEIRTVEELTVGIPETNETFSTLALRQMEGLPKPLGGIADRRRDALAKVLHWDPVTATATKVKLAQEGGVTATTYILYVDDWSVPSVVIEREDSHPASTCLLVADAGKQSLAEQTTALLDRGIRIVAIDPLFMGESVPLPNKLGPFAMLINATGARVLGEQVKQLTAAMGWVRDDFGDTPLHVHATGPNSAVAALAAGAFMPGEVDEVDVEGEPDSLHDLVTEPVHYDDVPALFCFGLYRHFDVEDIKALCLAYQGR